MQALIDKYKAQRVAGRLVAVVDGKRQYLTDLGADGRAYLTRLGVRLQSELAAVPAPTPQPTPQPTPEPQEQAPAKRGRKAAKGAADDVEIEV